MEEYSLDRHLKSYCDAHEEYQNLYATWSLNRKSCSEMLKTVLLRYPHYSLHDASHAEAILSKIEMLLGSRVSQLSPTDTWLVLHAAYAHDLGMVVQWRDLQNAWSDPAFQNYLTSLAEGEDKNLRNAVQWLRKMEAGKKDDALWPLHIVRSVQLIDAAYFRSQHAAMSKSYIERIAQGLQIDLGHSGLVRSRLLQLLGEICACHTAPEDQVLELPYETNGFGSDYAHPRFVAMLLRLGDLLDVDNGRFNAAAEEVIGGLPESSVAHKEKHEATKHLLITPERIEFASDGPDEPSYLEARRFVNWLEAEIRFLTMNWVILVPKGFGGFAPRFEKPKLCIKGVPDAEGLAGLHFEISQKKAFEIIEGSNIYENKLVFIRELLQNAMDASKIQLWRDLCAGTYQAWIGEKDSRKLQALQPYSLQAEIYHSYPIKIHLSTDEDQVTQIEIEDRGTGITLDTFKRMCNVGASPSGSDELKKEIQCMPKWLRPTAGFGIGLQSIFLVADRFEIVTNNGAEVLTAIAHSNQNGGYLQIKKEGSRPFRGTTIRIALKVPIAPSFTFAGKSFYYWYFQYDPMEAQNCLGELQILDEVSKNYGTSLFTVHVSSNNPSVGSQTITHLIPICENFAADKWERRDNYLIQFENDCSTAKLWNETNAVYAELSLHPESRSLSEVRFKGVLVKDNLLFHEQCLGAVIDIYGFDTKSCLRLNRSELTKEGNRILSDLMLELHDCYIEAVLARLNGTDKQDIALLQSKQFNLFHFWLACLPRQKAEIKTDHLKTLTETVFVLQYVNDSFKIQQVRLGSILPFDDNLFFVHGSMFKTADGLDYDRIDDVCKKLTAAAEKAPDLQKIILPLDERLIRAASNCHKAFIRRANGLFLYQISLFPVGLQVDAETRELLLKSLGERTLISRTIFDDEEHSPRRRAISGLADYPNLCVSRLPAGVMYSSFSHCNAIISPFNCDQKRLAESESCDLFVAQILESSAFQRVVQWTMDHAPDNAALRSVETVKQEYQKLMQDYYQVIHSAKKTQTHLNSTTSPAVES